MSNREFNTWLAHIDLELETPSRSDWYAMQIAAKVQTGWSHELTPIDSMRLSFGPEEEEEEEIPEDPEEREAYVKENADYRRAVLYASVRKGLSPEKRKEFEAKLKEETNGS